MKNNIGIILLFLILIAAGGFFGFCVYQDMVKDESIPIKVIDCFECGKHSAELDHFSGHLCWYECPLCGATMTYHRDYDTGKWELFSYNQKKKE